MSDHQRNWTTVGEDLVERVGGKAEVEAEIGRLDWQEVPKGGSLTVGFLPGAAINHAIAELRLPKVSHVAISSFDRPGTGGHDGFYPGFYGISCRYKDGVARVYVLDVGTELVPLLSDFWPAVPEEAKVA